ncbi:MAG: hypothetical protein U0166_20910 [Acidobacteriota bacterium]
MLPLARRRAAIPVAAALAFASMEAARAISARGLSAEVVVDSKRVGLEPRWGAEYLVTFKEWEGTLHEMPVSRTSWEALEVGDRLPARRTLGGRLFVVEMRCGR